MKFISWNVNGIRAAIKKGFCDFFNDENADFFCIQETKARPEQVDLNWNTKHHAYWNSAEKAGYSGTAIFSKTEPNDVLYGIGITQHDKEGRVITLKFDDFYLVNVYTPNSQNELRRLKYRQAWDLAFREFLKNLEKEKPIILCGDLNVAHSEIDLARPKANTKNPGFTKEEREGFDKLIEANFIDTFREFEKGGGHYSWWSYRAKARERNVGWRIDYWCISESLKNRLQSSTILDQIMGSDHCPVMMKLK
tara:strand:- start:367 stop:1119 length:753 start_codon:yes stop_codon:yes gene_type:complete